MPDNPVDPITGLVPRRPYRPLPPGRRLATTPKWTAPIVRQLALELGVQYAHVQGAAILAILEADQPTRLRLLREAVERSLNPEGAA